MRVALRDLMDPKRRYWHCLVGLPQALHAELTCLGRRCHSEPARPVPPSLAERLVVDPICRRVHQSACV